VGFSPRFLRAVADELARIERRVDAIDRRIEQAKRQAAKDRLSEQRAALARYDAWLRRNFLR
jgi:septal ring factor EnvC (AmiA/AmiB activator)